MEESNDHENEIHRLLDDDHSRRIFYRRRGYRAVGNIAPTPMAWCPCLATQMYFFAILGFWKLFGALTILVPRYPLLKEWAYAGIFFDLTGAAASCAWVGGYGAYGFHVIAPLIITGFTVASWALRPESRKIGILLPAKDSQAGVNTRAANIA